MKNKRLLILDVVILLVMIWGITYVNRPPQTKPFTTIKTDTVFITDTIHDSVPVPIASTPIKDIKIPIKYIDEKIKPDIRADPDTIYVIKDSNFLTLPISQKEYKTPSYHAWVSGYRASLDSIIVTQNNTVIHTEKAITHIKYKPKRWSLGIQVGWGLTLNKPQPYLGVGLQYNILSW